MSDGNTVQQVRETRDQADALARTLHQEAADETAKANDRFRAHVARDLCQEAARKLEEAADMLEPIKENKGA